MPAGDPVRDTTLPIYGGFHLVQRKSHIILQKKLFPIKFPSNSLRPMGLGPFDPLRRLPSLQITRKTRPNAPHQHPNSPPARPTNRRAQRTRRFGAISRKPHPPPSHRNLSPITSWPLLHTSCRQTPLPSGHTTTFGKMSKRKLFRIAENLL